MPAVAAVTHTVVWCLASDPKLSARAGESLDSAASDGEFIYVPSICLVELTYLIEKGRLPASSREDLVHVLDDPESPFRLAPLDRRIADVVEFVPRTLVPDLPDRIIAATAIALGVPLVARDEKIRASRVETVW
jgi:PIN domain nuclease of toxin-antitoxin system